MRFILGGLGNWYKNYEQTEKGILEADRLGFHAALIPDHYMWGDMGGMMHRPDSNVTMESWITLTYLAAKTEQIHLGTMVTPIPFRPPGMLAKMISTLDVLSNGRVIAGIGAGWSQVEFEGYSEWNRSKTRVDKTHEGLELMLELWTKNKVDFEGNYYKAKGAVLEPKPVQKPYPKLLFGSRGNRMLALSGMYGDIIYIPPWQRGGGPLDVEAARRIVLEAAMKAKRADKVGFMAGAMMGQQISGSDEYIKAIESAKASGHRYYLVSLPRDGDGAEFLGKFAEEVMPSFR